MLLPFFFISFFSCIGIHLILFHQNKTKLEAILLAPFLDHFSINPLSSISYFEKTCALGMRTLNRWREPELMLGYSKRALFGLELGAQRVLMCVLYILATWQSLKHTGHETNFSKLNYSLNWGGGASVRFNITAKDLLYICCPFSPLFQSCIQPNDPL